MKMRYVNTGLQRAFAGIKKVLKLRSKSTEREKSIPVNKLLSMNEWPYEFIDRSQVERLHNAMWKDQK